MWVDTEPRGVSICSAVVVRIEAPSGKVPILDDLVIQDYDFTRQFGDLFTAFDDFLFRICKVTRQLGDVLVTVGDLFCRICEVTRQFGEMWVMLGGLLLQLCNLAFLPFEPQLMRQ